MRNEKLGAGAKKASQGAFKWWNDKSTIKPGDSFGQKFNKVLIRISGIIFLIIFSPALLVALIITFLLAL